VGFWSRLFGTAERALSIDDYIQLANSFTFNGIGYSTSGIQQTLQGNVEKIDQHFQGYADGIYKTNGTVFACMLARRAVFTEARFQFRSFNQGRPGKLFGNPALAPIERPFPGGVTADLLARMLDDADLAGNWFGWHDKDNDEVVRLRPDWVDIVLEPRMVRGGQVGYRKLGYLYYEGGMRDQGGVPFLVDEVSHFAPIPDPTAQWRGMSWLTPVIREIAADKAMTAHKLKYLENGATPNMVVKLPEVSPDKLKRFKSAMDAEHKGSHNAGKTLYIGGGADVTVVGSDFKQLDLRGVQGASETKIASAAGVPPVVIGLSDSLGGSSLNAGNYSAARRNFADRTIRPLWRNAAASLEMLVPPPPSSQLWFDTHDVAFLREDEKDRAEIQTKEATTIRQLNDGGYTPDSVVAAVDANDWTLLEHTGLLSVQLQPPGTQNPGTDNGAPAPTNEE
jgi:hypothetical protein